MKKGKQNITIMKNKQGLFNIGGLISGIGNIANTVFGIFPKPIKFLFFLVLLLAIGGLINFSVQVFGVYCDSNDNVLSLGAGNLIQNLGLINEVPETEFLGLEVIEPDSTQWLTVSECTVCYNAGEANIILPNGTSQAITGAGQNCYYDHKERCNTCEGTIIDLDPAGISLTGNLNTYCDGDVYPKSEEELGLIGKATCGASWIGTCSPPEHYYWEQSINQYSCSDASCAGLTAGQIWDEKLQRAGGELLYPEGQSSSTSYTNFVSLQCTDLKPGITVFGINIFDYRLWALLTILILMVWFYIKFKMA